MKFSDCSVAIISPQWLLWALGASVGSRFSASWFSSWSWKVLFMRRQEDTCVSLTAGSSSGRHSGPLGPRLPLSALPLSCPGQVLQPCACTLLPTWNASPPAQFLLILAFQGSASAPSPPGSHPPAIPDPMAGPQQSLRRPPLKHWPHRVVLTYTPNSPAGLGAPRAGASVSDSRLASCGGTEHVC